jgi:hypothetical protein
MVYFSELKDKQLLFQSERIRKGEYGTFFESDAGIGWAVDRFRV